MDLKRQTLPLLNKGDIILVRWWDAYFRSGQVADDLLDEELALPGGGQPTQTTGYYYAHNKNKLIMNMTQGVFDWADTLIIPMGMISSLEIIKNAD